MELKVTGVSYGLLLSHTFPGLLVEAEIAVGLHFFAGPCLPNILNLVSGKDNVPLLILALVLLFAFATLLGFVIDGLHHACFEDIPRRIAGFYRKKPKVHDDEAMYRVMRSQEHLQLYIYLEDELWYPYEAYANIGIALGLGCLLLFYVLWSGLVDNNTRFWWVALTISTILTVCTLWEAWVTLQQYNRSEEALAANLGHGKNEP
jgi:hypothetical protein